MKKNLIVAVGLVLAGLSAPVLAQGNGFIRGEVGRSDVDFSVDGGSASDDDTSWGVRGGYWFNPNFAVEGFYTHAYKTSFNDGFDNYTLRLHGAGVGVVGKKNFGGAHQGFFIGGRAGGYERALSGARDAALEDMKEGAREIGADGIIGIDFDYEVLGENNGMMMVSVSGTAVKMG